MRNITVSVDDETYRRARIKAAELDTSVSALVRGYLQELAAEESEFESLAAQERELRDEVADFRGGDRLSRAEIYERGGHARSAR